MSTSKVDTSGVFQPITVHADATKLLLSSEQVLFRQNGIEFMAPEPIPHWTEMTVDLRCPVEGKPVRGTGVVVDCTGNRHAGYVVSLVFMNLTPQSQERLTQLSQRPGA